MEQKVMKKEEKMACKNHPTLTDLSHELLCHILQFLPLQDIMAVSMLCKTLQYAVTLHLRLCKKIDFCGGSVYGFMPKAITDDHLHFLFKKCPLVETVFGLHPFKVERRRLRKRSALTVPGIIDALSLCSNLTSVETSDLKLLEAMLQHLPQLRVIGTFQNRGGIFPPQASESLRLLPYPQISSMRLIGVEVPELTAMPLLEHLHLHCVRFTKLQPFRAFLAAKLKTFVMKHCMGPSLSLRYLSLIIALSSAPTLTRLELVRVPLPGGLFQRAVEDSFRQNAFVNLKTLIISGCKGILESDLGHLMIVASRNLEKVFIQPSLTRDSLFVALSYARCEFPALKDIHLGYIDDLELPDGWSNESLRSAGLAEIPDTPSALTDSGMKMISELFPHIRRMDVSNCPHLIDMDQWWNKVDDVPQGWKELTELTLYRCHCLSLPSFSFFLSYLQKIESLVLQDMFRAPPKGCSHVGLSAGTGLGMSSAVVSNQDEHIAVQGHQQDFEAQVDDNDNENEEIDNDDNEDEDNPDQHIMVFQQEFFEEENHVHHDDGHERVPLLVIPENAFDDDRIDNRIPVLMVPENAYEENRMENNMVHVLMVPENANEENRIENMEQEVPENQIRRELNEDYDAEANENANQGNIDEDQRTLSFDETSSSSSSEDDDDGYKYYINQASDRNKTYKKIKSSNLSKDINSNQNSGKKETKSFIKQHCAHSICTRNCSKGFDPNQPSTSKGGNCFNCPCNTFDSECKENENNSKAELKSKDVKYNDFSSEDSANIKKTVKSYLDNGIQGPMTRNRKRALDQDIKKKEFFYSSIEVGNPKRHKISEEKNMPSTSTNCASKKLQPKQEIMDSETTNSIDQNVEKRDKMKNNKISRISSQKDCTEQDKQKTKGHKKHNHKKCKYRRCERLCHKKGPLTRSKSIKQNDYNTVSQGTMATSADIRRTLRKQRSCSVRCKRRGNVGCGSLQCRSYNHISARQLHKKPRQEKPNVEVQNKSTSTSDPLMEDDPVQVLRLESRTLISLTIVQCGISDIVFDHLENLSYVEIQACRIFKKFQLNHCPSLKKFDVSECPKMTLENTASQILSLPSPKKLLVTFEPCMQNYCPAYAEKIIFSKALFDHSIILFHDYTNYIYDTMPANIKENILQWMELVQNVYQRPKCLAFYKYVQGKQKKRKNKDKLNLEELSNRTRYPYGHSLRRINGMYLMPPSRNPNSPSEGRYQILTNDQMFATCLELKSWDDGFPFPHCLESAEDTVLLNLLESEFTEENLKMKTKMISFYIPVIEDDLEEFDDDEDST